VPSLPASSGVTVTVSSQPDVVVLRRYVLALLIDVGEESRQHAARVVTVFTEVALAAGAVPVLVHLERTGHGTCLRIEMDNPHPLPLTVSPEDQRVLDQLTTGHGVSHRPDGALIWAEVALHPLDARTRTWRAEKPEPPERP